MFKLRNYKMMFIFTKQSEENQGLCMKIMREKSQDGERKLRQKINEITRISLLFQRDMAEEIHIVEDQLQGADLGQDRDVKRMKSLSHSQE